MTLIEGGKKKNKDYKVGENFRIVPTSSFKEEKLNVASLASPKVGEEKKEYFGLAWCSNFCQIFV
jgi:hypothetical protein